MSLGEPASYLSALSSFLGCDWMSFLNLTAYCDESYAHRESAHVVKPFIIAGYIGRRKIWKAFEREWRRLLKAEKLPYFHMADCEGAAGKLFGHIDLKTEAGRRERDRLQTVFIDAINRYQVYGVAVGVPQGDMAALHDELAQFRPPLPGQKQSMVTPYMFALEVCFNAMIARLKGVDESERLAFVFDQQQEYEGRAHALRAHLVENDLYPNANRLGPLTYDDKKLAVPLQAADILAYEVMREIRDHDGPRRWQRSRLDRARVAHVEYFTRALLDGFVTRVHMNVAQLRQDG